MGDFLQRVMIEKKQEVNALKRGTKSLKHALMAHPRAIIAEIKRHSPAKGHLSDIIDPVSLALTYHRAGAPVISVLTDKSFFHGCIDDLKNVSQALIDTPCVVLRKEFIVDPIQLYEAKFAGADAVLLIAAVLGDKTLPMIHAAHAIGLEVLLEVHAKSELDFALCTDADVIGVNNRHLQTLEVNIETSIQLSSSIPKDVIAVSESGIHNAETALTLFDRGYRGLLIGEALVKSSDPASLLSAFQGISA